MNLNDMLQSEGYMTWQGDIANNMDIHYPERWKRCDRAAKQGADGSFHAEIISDWQRYLELLPDISERDYHEINIEIMDCWDWHDKEGSLYDEVG